MIRIHLISSRIIISFQWFRNPKAKHYSCNADSTREKHNGDWRGWIRVYRFHVMLKYVWRRKFLPVCYLQAYTDDGGVEIDMAGQEPNCGMNCRAYDCDAVSLFCREMDRRMIEHIDWGCWSEMTVEELSARLLKNLSGILGSKLSNDVEYNAAVLLYIRDQAADIANFAMMLSHNYGQLRSADSPRAEDRVPDMDVIQEQLERKIDELQEETNDARLKEALKKEYESVTGLDGNILRKAIEDADFDKTLRESFDPDQIRRFSKAVSHGGFWVSEVEKRMGEKTKGALTDALLELSVNDLVQIQYQLSKGKMVAEIMEHNLDHVQEAIDECGLHDKVCSIIGQETPVFSTSGKFFDDSAKLIEMLKNKKNLELVTTNGCFDIIHAGHIDCLEKCKNYGNFLLVLVNGDRRVMELKGPDRPFVDWKDRVSVICALEAVDAVMLFKEDTPCLTLLTLCENGIIPVTHIKSGGYQSLEELPEHQLLLEHGSKAHIIPPLEGISTTDLVEKIRNSEGDKDGETK